jgi:tRNA threonylcarbamoyladenosine biosynthesis protein TsaB
MSLILNIDTALETAAVCLARDGEVVNAMLNSKQGDHAAWLHPAIADLLKQNGNRIDELDAVAVSIGPGSYTGLRIGLAAAKGFCYALQVPLITVGTLEIMADTVKDQAEELIGPLIDARRMEVFAAVYDKALEERIAPHALALDESSFGSILVLNKILFCGSGSMKLQTVLSHSNASIIEMGVTHYSLARMSYKYFLIKRFAAIAYIEPMYLKDFHNPARKD